MSQLLTSKKFITIYILAVCHFFYGYFFQIIYKFYGKDYINDDQFLTFVGATASFSNGFFKIFVGGLIDKYPFRKIYGTLITLEILMIVGI